MQDLSTRQPVPPPFFWTTIKKHVSSVIMEDRLRLYLSHLQSLKQSTLPVIEVIIALEAILRGEDFRMSKFRKYLYEFDNPSLVGPGNCGDDVVIGVTQRPHHGFTHAF